MKLAFRWMFAAALLAIVLPAGAQWAWRDASGKMVFSDQPPPKSIPPKDIVRQPSGPTGPRYNPVDTPAAEAAAAPKATAEAGKPASKPTPTLADREIEAKRRQQELAEAEKKAADEQQRQAQLAENCQRLMSHQKALDSGMRMARVNATTGQREVLDDKARAAESERNRAQIEQFCQQ
jgi:hypothetical protein